MRDGKSEQEKTEVTENKTTISAWRISKFQRYFSHGGAADGSPRREPWERWEQDNEPRSGERKCFDRVLSPLRGSLSCSHLSHGSRRGLPSAAPPWLKYRWNFEMRHAEIVVLFSVTSVFSCSDFPSRIQRPLHLLRHDPVELPRLI